MSGRQAGSVGLLVAVLLAYPFVDHALQAQTVYAVTDGMISAIIKATKPADARPLVDLAARREMLPVAEAGGCCGGAGCC